LPTVTTTRHVDFSAKLRLTAAAIGCTGRKAFCARFHAVNPRTQCEVERLNKWMQGRALPRGADFYEDWKAVLASHRPAAWFETSSVEDFATELAALTGIPAEELLSHETRQTRAPENAPAVFGAQQAIYGAFACYSHAFSPLFRGKLIRGTLRITPGQGTTARAAYTEALISGTYRMTGDVILSAGMMHILLKEGTNDLPLFLCLIAPGPPASVLCGVLAGPTLTSNVPAPTSTRFAAVRVPDGPDLDQGNGYLDTEPGLVLDNLAGTGLSIPHRQKVGEQIMGFLGASAHQVSLVDQLLLCDLLDSAHLPAR
jgi:hypothetical protein